MPGWRVDRRGRFARRHISRRTCRDAEGPVVVISHGHFSRILAARALGLSPDHGRLLARATASVCVVEDYHGERCIGVWNASADRQTPMGGADATGAPRMPPHTPPAERSIPTLDRTGGPTRSPQLSSNCAASVTDETPRRSWAAGSGYLDAVRTRRLLRDRRQVRSWPSPRCP
ncbi:MAG: histidine phosphatase family protein [Actinomycetota bacterium]|nr:histidine phosphatase family protein [Actinomycetota bacterium]